MPDTRGLFISTSTNSESGEVGSVSATGHRIVFVHGAMDRHTSFAKVRSRLAPCLTVAYDRRGYGRSVGLGPAGSFRDHVDDLVSVIDGQRSVLVGHSYGGNVCLAVAGELPELVAAMVVFEAPMSWEDWWPSTAGSSTIAVGDAHGPEAAAEAFMRRIVGDRTWEGLNDQTKAARRAEGRALLFDLAGLRGRGRPYEPSLVACPTIIGYGEESLPHQIRSSVELHNLLSDPATRPPAGSGSFLRPVGGARHGAHSSDPAGFGALVREAIELAHPA